MNGSKEKPRIMAQVKAGDAYETECSLLGAMLYDDSVTDAVAAITQYLDRPDCFYGSVHQKLFKAILALWNEGRPTDIESVFSWLRENDSMKDINSRVQLMNLIEARSMPSQIPEHAKIVLHAALRRKLETFGSNIIQSARDYGHGVDEIMAAAEQGLVSIENAYRGDSVVPLSCVLPQAKSDFEKLRRGEITGLLTGYSDLDRITKGFHPGELIILAARPSVGKSALALNIAENLIMEGKPVGLISLEMKNIENSKRLILSRGRIELPPCGQKINDGNWCQIDEAINRLTGLPLYMNDHSDITITRLRSIATKMRLNYGICLLIVDYLQLTNCGRNVSSRNEEVSLISKFLKGLSGKLSIPILALSQLNRAIEGRGPKATPMLSDLRDSGSIEQDADLVIFIKPDPSGSDNAELIIRKQRNGAHGSLKLHFQKKIVRWNLVHPGNEVE